MQINAQHHRIILLSLTAILIFWLGRLSIAYQASQAIPPAQIIPEVNEKIPMVEILDIRNGEIIGIVNSSEIRLKSGESVAVPDQENRFTLDIQHLGFLGQRQPVVTHQIPEWAQFVASKNGKYFYEVDSASGKNLSVENRVYFASEEEAVGAGYLRRGR